HPAVDGLKVGLHDLGLEGGRDVIFDIRLTDGEPDRITAAAIALAKAGVDVIFTSGETATLAAKAATPTTPGVVTLVGGPVAAGIVKSLTQPGGNLTGISSLTVELVPKRLEALKALAPMVRRLWAIELAANPASSAAISRALGAAALFRVEIMPRTVRTPTELDQALEGLRPGDALLVPDVASMDISAVLLEISL